jgi:5-oxoprolinase (ATP-hydrolysing)
VPAVLQSSGGLTEASRFQGKDAILSGPAGGIVRDGLGARAAGHDRVIGFDMGGTSTGVSHYAGEYEPSRPEVASARASVMMNIIPSRRAAVPSSTSTARDSASGRIGRRQSVPQVTARRTRDHPDANVPGPYSTPVLSGRIWAHANQPLDAGAVEIKFAELRISSPRRRGQCRGDCCR